MVALVETRPGSQKLAMFGAQAIPASAPFADSPIATPQWQDRQKQNNRPGPETDQPPKTGRVAARAVVLPQDPDILFVELTKSKQYKRHLLPFSRDST